MTSTVITADENVDRHAALDRAIVGLWPTAYRLAFLVLRDRMAAEDVAQESCIRALRGKRGLRDDAAIQSWFRTIVLRLALSARKRALRSLRREEPLGTQPEPSTRFDLSESHDLVKAIDALGDDLRLPLILAYYGGFTSAEIGKRLGVAPATVRYRLSAARNVLRPLLESIDR
jgi:RNA polymerase sigma-70 factor, ECF subfamily